MKTINASDYTVDSLGNLIITNNNGDKDVQPVEDKDDFDKENYVSKESEDISKETTEKITKKIKKEDDETDEGKGKDE